MFEYCGAHDRSCFQDLYLFSGPFLLLFIAFAAHLAQLNAKYRKLKEHEYKSQGYPTLSQVIFGKSVNPENNINTENGNNETVENEMPLLPPRPIAVGHITFLERLDKLRLSVIMMVAVLPLLTLAFANSDAKDSKYDDEIDVGYRLNGLHVWVDSILVNGVVPYMMVFYLVLREVQMGSSESLFISIVLLVQAVCHVVKLRNFFQGIFAIDGKDAGKLVFPVEGVLIMNVVELIFKVTLCLLYTCFKRDTIILRHQLHRATNINVEYLLDRDESDAVCEDLTQLEHELQHEVESGEYDNFGKDYVKLAKAKRTPEQYTGLWDRLTFGWLSELMKTGYQRPLEEEDFYKLLPQDETKLVAKKFENAWKEVYAEYEAKHPGGAPRPVKTVNAMDDKDDTDYWILVKALHRSGLLQPFYEAAFLKIIYDTLNFVPPQMVNAIITFMADSSNSSVKEGFIYCLILFVAAVAQTLILHQYFHKVYRTGMVVRSALIPTIYKKSLSLSRTARDEQSTGQIVNLMSADCSRLQGLFTYLHIAWSAPYVILVSCVFLWFQMKWVVFVSVGVIVLFIIPFSAWVTNKIKDVNKILMKVKDERIKLTSETISSVKVLKMYGWERAFREKISLARRLELARLWNYFNWRNASIATWNIAPIIMTVVTFATYTIVEGKSFDPATAFTTLSLLNILRFPLAMLPSIINAMSEATVSLRRISKFLQSSEVQNTVEYNSDTHVQGNGNGKLSSAEVALSASHAYYYWDDMHQKSAVKDINLIINKGDLCILTGKVGSGKSALLKMFLNDLIPGSDGSKSQVTVSGSIAFANQVPWIQNASLKENILFGKPYEKDWYDRVVFACGLEPDLKQLPLGDLTEIGERGINVSGGQKARIALARAVYSKHEILLLESCFEAVDEHVGDHIWDNCIKELLHSGKYGKRTVVLVTHALKRLNDVDKIIIMDNGTISVQGTYKQLAESKHQGFFELIEVLKAKQRSRATDEAEGAGDGKSDDNSSGKENLGGDMPKSERKLSTKAENKGLEEKKQAEQKKKAAENDLTGKEERGVGQVPWSVYKNYIQSSGGMLAVLIINIAYVIKTALDFLTTRWLAYWSSHGSIKNFFFNQYHAHYEEAGYVLGFEPQWMNFSMHKPFYSSVQANHGPAFYLEIYALLSILTTVSVIASAMILLYSGFTASKKTHDLVLFKVMRAKMSFFDTTPTGRILNRFTKDIYTLDEILPFSFQSFMGTTYTVVGTVFSISYVAPAFLLALPFLSGLYRMIQKYYIASSRELQRWDSVLRSPIFSFFTETLDGSTTIRAYGSAEFFMKKNQMQVDRNQRCAYLSFSANRWLAVRLEFIGTFLVIAASLFVVLRKNKIDPSLAGLALSYAFSITQTLNWTVRMFSELETNIVSVERLNDYIQLDSEAAEVTDAKTSTTWPDCGEIQFVNVKACYRDGLPLVLKGISFTIKAGEKVGIVGRTGAGKSTLFLALLRLMELSEGQILVDGVDIKTIGLELLRQSLAIIPQDPVMFTGTIKHNLDPVGHFSDEKMMEVLRLCHLDEHLAQVVKSSLNDQKKDDDKDHHKVVPSNYPELDILVSESGSNLSFGQRQLICIGRALLRGCKILLLDEATSGIDIATDALIQATIRDQFASCTVLTVAHRIETILGGDRVMVLDNGLVSEFDRPNKLINTRNSMFAQLVEKMRAENSHS